MLQKIKFLIRDQLGLPSTAVLMAVGCGAHLALNALLRKSPTSAWGLLAPLGLGVAIESYEIWLQYKNIGLFAAGNDPVLIILLRHARDIAYMLAGPLILVAFGTVSAR